MQKEIVSFLLIGVVIITLLTTGCMDIVFDDSTRYESYPTAIQYTIRYGYNLSVAGTGSYSIHFACDTPQVLQGEVTPVTILYPGEYQEIMVGGNKRIVWDINGSSANTYELGVTTSVVARSYLVSDLTGKNALTLEQIPSQHPTLVMQYCGLQAIDETRYIDPYQPDIQDTARRIYNQSESKNAFVLAQAIFVWLKQNTEYRLHESESVVQPASETFILRTGDCDDLSFLYISLCRSLGIPARFIRGYLIESNQGDAVAGPHAWVEVFVGGGMGNNGWVPVECAGVATLQAEVHQNFGVENAFHLRLFVDEGSNESLNLSLSGISWVYSSSITITADAFTELSLYSERESKQLVITKDNQRSYQ
ncbi:MAG: transglutaminase-like domain-containing protein [Methanobacteriota archaeon]